MATLIHRRFVNLGAAATAAIVALGMVAVPPERYQSFTASGGVVAVQLRASVSTQIITLADAVNTLPSPTSATPEAAAVVDLAPPKASATGGTDALGKLAIATLALVAAPFWYIGFPITLPLSVVGGIALSPLLNSVARLFGGGSDNPFDFGLGGAILGLGAFIVGPLGIAFGALSSLSTAPASSLLPAASQRPISDASTVRPSEATSAVATDATTATDPDQPAEATKPDGVAKRTTGGAPQRVGVTAQRVAERVALQSGAETPAIESALAGSAEATPTVEPVEEPTASDLVAEPTNSSINTGKTQTSPTEQTSRSTGSKRTSAQTPSRNRGNMASTTGGAERSVEN